MALTTTSATGTQTATDSPQQVGAGSTTAQSSGVQPGTTASILNGKGSIPLTNTPVTTVSLTNAVGQTQAPSLVPLTVSKPHHINYGLFSISGVLLLLAIVMFIFTSRSDKTTTE